jgi:DNA-binding IclR family transcriptional regulator
VGAASRFVQVSGGAQTLDRGLAVLDALAGQAASIAELSAQLGLHRSIVTRLLTTLERRHYVARGADNRYRLAGAVLSLARAVEDPVRSTFRPLLGELADTVGATAALTIMEGTDALCVEAVEPSGSHLHIAYRPGLRHPLDAAASGLAILSALAPAPGERPDVARARAQGYAVSTGELQAGAVGVAAPVSLPGRSDPGSVAVVGLAGSLDVGEVVPALRATLTRAGVAHRRQPSVV